MPVLPSPNVIGPVPSELVAFLAMMEPAEIAVPPVKALILLTMREAVPALSRAVPPLMAPAP